MQAAYYPAYRARNAVLDEPAWLNARRAGDIRIERPGEEAAVINMRRRLEEQRAGNARNRTHDQGLLLSRLDGGRPVGVSVQAPSSDDQIRYAATTGRSGRRRGVRGCGGAARIWTM